MKSIFLLSVLVFSSSLFIIHSQNSNSPFSISVVPLNLTVTNTSVNNSSENITLIKAGNGTNTSTLENPFGLSNNDNNTTNSYQQAVNVTSEPVLTKANTTNNDTAINNTSVITNQIYNSPLNGIANNTLNTSSLSQLTPNNTSNGSFVPVRELNLPKKLAINYKVNNFPILKPDN